MKKKKKKNEGKRRKIRIGRSIRGEEKKKENEETHFWSVCCAYN